MKSSKSKHKICDLDELQPGQRRIVEIGNRSIGVFNINGALHAIKNTCPHQGAELCKGTVGGTMLPSDKPGEYRFALAGQVIRCPWHFWEFDITTGEMIFVPDPKRVKTYEVGVETAESPKLEKFDVEVENQVVFLYL
ncbi:MAG: nitrite reductase/ring-hydroxylating ferredoxin subunit [Cellvibrionaceae bacterium]|jgi:nitrite reductase/ring-hydroxylating ferredoxin subunit